VPPQQYGGQAVIEGVMMRGPHHFAVACRRAGGEIALTREPVPRVLRPAWQKVPFLRGAFALVDAMALGTRALFWAAKIAEQDTAPPANKAEARAAEEWVGPALGTAAPDLSRPRSASRVTDVAIGGAMFTGLALGLCLIVVIPNLIAEAARWAGIRGTAPMALLDGFVRLGIFFGYIGLVSRMHYVRRVFQYHGAEHKVINALESGAPLTVEAARAQSRLHPRCGTSFVVIVMVIATIVFAFSRQLGLPVYLRIPVELLLTLPVAGIAFELLRLAGRYRNNPLAAALSRPGMWTQLLTTREPDDSQIEVALASLRAVIDAEQEDASPADAPERQAAAVA
jgi:uncharacterized protein YqhQ